MTHKIWSDRTGRELVAVFCGGAVGALARVWLERRYAPATGDWPWTTFVINVSGSFVLAYVATHFEERLPHSVFRRLLLGTGFCGAYTTFSTMQLETLHMLDAGRVGLALAYAALSTAAGLGAVYLATTLVRRRALA